MKEDGRVVMLADAVYEGIEGAKTKDANPAQWKGSPFNAGSLAEPRPLVLAPYQELTDSAAALGHNLGTPDDDGQLRRLVPFITSDGKQLPSLGVAAALLAGGFQPSDVEAEGDTLRIGDRNVQLVWRRIGDNDQ